MWGREESGDGGWGEGGKERGRGHGKVAGGEPIATPLVRSAF